MKESMNILAGLNLFSVEEDFRYYRIGDDKNLSLVVPIDFSEVIVWRRYEGVWYKNEVITDVDELLKFIDDVRYEESQRPK